MSGVATVLGVLTLAAVCAPGERLPKSRVAIETPEASSAPTTPATTAIAQVRTGPPRTSVPMVPWVA